jgi:hypothetical protein
MDLIFKEEELMADKFINDVGLQVIKQWIEGKFALDADLDALTARVEEIIAEGGEPNVIETVKVNNVALPVAAKAVNVTVPVNASDLNNDGDGDSPFATQDYVDENGGKIDKIKVNDVEQIITNKTVNITMPTKVSELTNDGDGTTGSKFATEDYVDENGGKIDVIKVNGTAQTITNKTVDLAVPTKVSDLENDEKFQTEDEVEQAIADAIVGALKPKGSCLFAELPAPSAAVLHNMYDVADAFTTTDDFREGAGHRHSAGTNVAVINVGTDAAPVYKYDAMPGPVDLSAYWTSTAGENNTLLAMTTAEINAILNPTP